MGNSTRLTGVVQALRRRASREALRVVVGTGGRAARYWATHAPALQAEILALESYRFAERQEQSLSLGWGGFLRPRNARLYARNSRLLNAFLGENSVDAALIDSDYHVLPLLSSGVPITALGQASDVVRRCAADRGVPSVSTGALLIERLDAAFQRAVSLRTLVPAFEPIDFGIARATAVPLIVREEFTVPVAAPIGGPEAVRVVLSGSGIGSAPLLAWARRHSLTVLDSLGGDSWAVDAQGRPVVDRASAVVIQGGLSSISECIARRRKMIVVPIPGHAEQRANAFEVERRGLGLSVAELSEPPGALLERLARSTIATQDIHWPRVDGAKVVAGILLESLGLADARA